MNDHWPGAMLNCPGKRRAWMFNAGFFHFFATTCTCRYKITCLTNDRVNLSKRFHYIISFFSLPLMWWVLTDTHNKTAISTQPSVYIYLMFRNYPARKEWKKFTRYPTPVLTCWKSAHTSKGGERIISLFFMRMERFTKMLYCVIGNIKGHASVPEFLSCLMCC